MVLRTPTRGDLKPKWFWQVCILQPPSTMTKTAVATACVLQCVCVCVAVAATATGKKRFGGRARENVNTFASKMSELVLA